MAAGAASTYRVYVIDGDDKVVDRIAKFDNAEDAQDMAEWAWRRRFGYRYDTYRRITVIHPDGDTYMDLEWD